MENRRGRKIAVDLLACLGAGFILLLAAVLIVPRIIDRGSMGDNLRSEVSKLVKGVFDFKRIDLSLFPMPHVLLADATLNIPQRISASIPVIDVYLEILPLLTRTTNTNGINANRS